MQRRDAFNYFQIKNRFVQQKKSKAPKATKSLNQYDCNLGSVIQVIIIIIYRNALTRRSTGRIFRNKFHIFATKRDLQQYL